MSNYTEGIFLNTSPEPTFFGGKRVGGHEFVFIDGFDRIPGNFVRVDDPKDDHNLSEDYQAAFKALQAKADRERKPVHENTKDQRSNVITPDPEPEAATEAKDPDKATPKHTTRTRKVKSGSASTDGDDQ